MDSEAIIEVLLWVISGLAAIGVAILGIIGYFMRTDREETKQRLKDHDEKFEKTHEEIHAIALTTGKAIASMEQQIENNTKTLDLIMNKKTR